MVIGFFLDRLCPPLAVAEVACRATFLARTSEYLAGMELYVIQGNSPDSCHMLIDWGDEILDKSEKVRVR